MSWKLNSHVQISMTNISARPDIIAHERVTLLGPVMAPTHYTTLKAVRLLY